MVNNDSELIDQVRELTDYGELIIGGAEMETLLQIAKEEVRSSLGDPDQLTFYDAGSEDADRALFWFLCIASKVKVGEIGGLEIDADDFAAQQPDEYQNSMWFRQYQKKRSLAEGQLGGSGAASSSIQRTGREYVYDRPEGGL